MTTYKKLDARLSKVRGGCHCEAVFAEAIPYTYSLEIASTGKERRSRNDNKRKRDFKKALKLDTDTKKGTLHEAESLSC